MRIDRSAIPAGVMLATSVLLIGCSFTKFDDLEDSAPAVRVDRPGPIQSDFFGQLLTGVAPTTADGGRLLVAGTGSNPTLNAVFFNAAGQPENAQTDRNDYRDSLDLGDLLPRSLAAGPSGQSSGSLDGPFAYVGANSTSEGRVAVADVLRFESAATIRPGDPTQTVEFGASVAGARFDASAFPLRDLAVGGRSAIWLFRFDTWPSTTTEKVISGGLADWPEQNSPESTFKALATGDLDASTANEDEVVAAAYDKNFVVLIHGVSSCIGSATDCGLLRIAVPDQADAFGQALLIADIDQDGSPELVIGAPKTAGGGAVYVYNVDAAAISGGTLPPPTKIDAPSGAADFGHSLAYGLLEGTTRPLLAIGAPGSAVKSADGAKTVGNAGKIYLYADVGSAPAGEVALKDPVEGDLLGAALTIMPFRVGTDVVADVLASSGKQAMLVFFANITDEQKDVRAR